ncbi:MAG: universal stress protein [Chloroflexales bacterium]|nr:universal stress protein [Chloroflexales bacterium]
MTVPIKKVLACVDGSAYLGSVCQHAGWAAMMQQVPLRVLHVQTPFQQWISPSNYPNTMGAPMPSELFEQFNQLEQAHKKLEQQRGAFVIQKAKMMLADVNVPIEMIQVVGTLVDAVGTYADSTNVVIGKRGEDFHDYHQYLGANLEPLIRATHGSVLVCAPQYTKVERLVIAYDGSANSYKALEFVINHPLFANVECHLVGVSAETDRASLQLDKAAGILRQTHHNVVVSHSDGFFDDVLREYIGFHNINLLLMGAYSHSTIRSMFIGSTTNAMLQSCPVSVLLFH